MKLIRKLIFLLASIAIVSSLLSTSVPPATPTGYCASCETIRGACADIWWTGMYNLCLADGNPSNVCAASANTNYSGCVIENSNGACPPYAE